MPLFSTDLDRFLRELLVVEQLVGLLVDQNFVGIAHVDAPRLGAPPPSLPNMSPIEIVPICAPGMPGMSNIGMPPPATCTSISISLSSSSPARSRLRNALLGRGAGAGADQGIEHALLGSLLRLGLHVLALALARQRDGDLDEVAHDLLDVAADIADLGELGRLHLEERRAGELGEAAGNLGLADAGRADHQDVLRQHFLAQPVVELQPAPAVAQRDRDRALGVVLADDVAVEFRDDFARGKVGHGPYSTFKAQRPGRRSPPDQAASTSRS